MTVATKTRWPTMADYQEAVQAPSICFPDPGLRNGRPVMNKLGLPRPICGQFASVYEIETGGARFAVKCFLRNIPDQHDRYARISEHLRAHRTPYFVTFEYQNEGIRVRGELRPLVKMEWIHGLALNAFIEKNLSRPSTLLGLERRWLGLLEDLRAASIAHGDLQHGNVLVVEDESLRLIDYDGMWVPALEGQTSHETGHPGFQSPLRTAKYFHAGIDLFSGAAIQIALRALAREPGLWSRYNSGDNLLFRREDYLKPAESALIAELKKLKDEVIDERLKVLVEACTTLPTREESVAKAGGSSRGDTRSGPREERKKRSFWRRKREKPETQSAQEQPKPKNGVDPAGPPPTSGTDPVTTPAGAPRAAGKTPSSWMRDHVAAPAGAPEAAPPQSPETPPDGAAERRPGFFRFFLHLPILAPMAVPAIAEWFDFLGINASAMTGIQEAIVTTTMVLGVLSLATLVVFRRHHHWAGDFFFGFTLLVSVCDLATRLWTIGSPATLQENLYHFGFGQLLLVCSGLGWVLHPDPE